MSTQQFDFQKHPEGMADGITGLGEKIPFPTEYSPSLLERFANQYPQTQYEVTLNCPEFTALCPKTGQPDFGTITITYTPREWLVESKSLKLYLGSFRNHGSFHEAVICQICSDLAQLLEPYYLTVYGEFNPRGGISIRPTASWHFQNSVNLMEIDTETGVMTSRIGDLEYVTESEPVNIPVPTL